MLINCFRVAVWCSATTVLASEQTSQADSLASSTGGGSSSTGGVSSRVELSGMESSTAGYSVEEKAEDVLSPEGGKEKNLKKRPSAGQILGEKVSGFKSIFTKQPSADKDLPVFRLGANVILQNHSMDGLNGLKGVIGKQTNDGRWKVKIDKEQTIETSIRSYLEGRKFAKTFTEAELSLTFKSGDRVVFTGYPGQKDADKEFNGHTGTIQKEHPTTTNKWYVILDKSDTFENLPASFRKQISTLKQENGDEILTISVREYKLKLI